MVAARAAAGRNSVPLRGRSVPQGTSPAARVAPSPPGARVDSRQLLQGIRSLEDLPALAAALGHEPLWDPVPGRPRADRRRRPRGRFPWYALSGPRAERGRASAGAQAGGRGRLCGVLGLDPDCHGGSRSPCRSTARHGCRCRSRPRPSASALAALGRLGVRRLRRRRRLRRARRRRARRRGGRPAVLPRVPRHAGPDGGRPSRPAPRRGPPRARPASAHPRAVPLLRPGQGMAGGQRPVSRRGGGSLPRAEAAGPPRPAAAALLRHAQPARGRAEPRGARASARFPSSTAACSSRTRWSAAAGRHPQPSWRDAFDRLFERFHFTVAEGERGRHRARHAGPRVRGRDGAG